MRRGMWPWRIRCLITWKFMSRRFQIGWRGSGISYACIYLLGLYKSAHLRRKWEGWMQKQRKWRSRRFGVLIMGCEKEDLLHNVAEGLDKTLNQAYRPWLPTIQITLLEMWIPVPLLKSTWESIKAFYMKIVPTAANQSAQNHDGMAEWVQEIAKRSVFWICQLHT